VNKTSSPKDLEIFAICSNTAITEEDYNLKSIKKLFNITNDREMFIFNTR
jgi:hypothetical protein